MNDNLVDDKGTTQEEAREMLRNLNENGFEGDVERLARVLGRTTEEISGLLAGSESFDDDLAIKIRGIALERNIALE